MRDMTQVQMAEKCELSEALAIKATIDDQLRRSGIDFVVELKKSKDPHKKRELECSSLFYFCLTYCRLCIEGVAHRQVDRDQ